MSAVNFENGRRAVPMSAISSGEEGKQLLRGYSRRRGRDEHLLQARSVREV